METTEVFDDRKSSGGFIDGQDYKEVIAKDTEALARIGGSFAEIATRMELFWHKAQVAFLASYGSLSRSLQIDDILAPLREQISLKYGQDIRSLWARPEIRQEFNLLFAQKVLPLVEKRFFVGEKVIIWAFSGTEKGPQKCPFDNCPYTWSGTAMVYSREGSFLSINLGTAHLASAHHLLEKGKDNPFATDPEKFYRYFIS